MKRFAALAAALVLLLPTLAPAQAMGMGRSLGRGFFSLGTAPGVNFGGHALPRALYMDAFQVGYVLPNGLELGYALTGMNWFPDTNDYSVSMNRFSVGWRPFLSDPLPMVQPYLLAGAGFGGEGRYVCEADTGCDPSKTSCRKVCGRADWRATMFAGGGIDISSRLFDIGSQQLLFYMGAQLRYEYMPDRYHMGVITFPIGLRLL